ncbi:ABC transporter ATP-binding protein [Kribbella sp. GL6]|uniref:ABC transporter ATP-binding protein n=1 Tax=Kribbella sp. GL6 TaxID=3419765 RepID=UPI003D008431
MLEVRGISKTFRRFGKPPVRAISDVSLDVGAAETVGLVGESGAGKSTVLRCLLALERPDQGSVVFDGRAVAELRGKELAAYRRRVQVVFQDPAGSLNPRMTVAQLVGEGMLIHQRCARGEVPDRVAELLAKVGLSAAVMDRRPPSFSGGQLQRIAIARALAVEPQVLICDEPVSALDVSVQAQVLNLLADMREQLGLSILLVSHNLAVIRYLCSRVFVLQHGTIVEAGSREQIFDRPQHEYTRDLLAAVPRPRTTTTEGQSC